MEMVLYMRRGEARRELKKITEAIADYEKAHELASAGNKAAVYAEIEKLKKIGA